MWVWIHQDLALFHPVTTNHDSSADHRVFSDLWEPTRTDGALSESPKADGADAPDAIAPDARHASEEAAADLEDIHHPHMHLQ